MKMLFRKWEQTNIPNVPKNDPDDGGGYLKREAIKYACVVVSAELAETGNKDTKTNFCSVDLGFR